MKPLNRSCNVALIRSLPMYASTTRPPHTHTSVASFGVPYSSAAVTANVIAIPAAIEWSACSALRRASPASESSHSTEEVSRFKACR